MRSAPIIIADADGIVAQAFPDDLKHKEAELIAQKLTELNAKILYPITAVIESVTFIQRALSSGATAYGTAVTFTDPGSNVIEIDQVIYNTAVNNYFGLNISKQDTLFDCIVAAVAERYEADYIFSWDGFYKKKGFKLTSELLLH